MPVRVQVPSSVQAKSRNVCFGFFGSYYFTMLKYFLNKSKTSLANKELIFIHIPKCGGSIFVGLLMDSIKPKNFDPTTPTHKIDKVGNKK